MGKHRKKDEKIPDLTFQRFEKLTKNKLSVSNKEMRETMAAAKRKKNDGNEILLSRWPSLLVVRPA